jgi:kynureninase
LKVFADGKKVVDELRSKKIFVDYREPNIIRIAPAPLYSSYQDVYTFFNVFKENILK